ncbi:ice-binding family protein [Hymenobacter guriensis]|uniref:DUF3494 domain-containing protein n=1 Tax=Hymenobacter guriensis TaxID=2793065 RepID=A0ABS0L8W6_9BACT|nr:ice-binding family protein [Hymenobacter guriensis]MBG8555884.1 DUF3494 domain-containing protein [Hymenobacter guriensis]
MKLRVPLFLAATLLILPKVGFGQAPPPLGAAADFTLFTAVGAINNSGPTLINGDIGTNAGAFNGFPPGVVNGNIHVADTRSTQAATAVQTAYGYYSTNIPCVTPLAVYGGTPAVTLLPGSYCVGGATTLAGTLILDAGGNPNAKFYLSVSGALTTGANSVVLLQNGASADNVYWQIGGLVTLGQNSVMVGTLLVDGAINMIQGAQLTGRGLSRSGAITIDTNNASLPTVVVVPVVTFTSWLGIALGGVDTDWFKSANWSAGVPTSTVDAIVGTGRSPFPVINSGTAAARALTIGANASLTQGGGSLDLKGNLNNSGTVSATAGIVSMSGTNSQLLGGSGSTQFWSLRVNNANGALQSGAVSIHGVLTPATGNLTTNGRTLTLLSDAAGTAMVDNSGSGAVLGTATVQRYILSGNNGLGYRHYSSPVVSTTVADLATAGFTPVVNNGYNADPTPGDAKPYPTVFGYDEQRLDTSPATALAPFSKGWFSPASLASSLERGRGYTVNLPGTALVDFEGTLNNGPIAQTGLTRTTTDAASSGWHLLGNPYPSPIDWSALYQSGASGLNGSVYIFASSGQYSGNYSSFVNGVPFGGQNIAAAQGFFVRVTTPGTTGSLTFSNAARLTTYANPAFQRGPGEQRPLVQLDLLGQNQADAAYAYWEQGATPGFDARFDAVKFPVRSGLSLALLAGTEEMSISGLPALNAATTTELPLTVRVPAAGTYTLHAAQLLNLPAGMKAYLRDAQTGQLTDLNAQPRYAFSTATDGLQAPRFTLVLSAGSVLAAAPAALREQVALYPNPARDAVRVLLPASLSKQPVEAVLVNSLGQTVRRQTVAADQRSLSLRDLAPGVYTVQLRTAQGLIAKRLVVQ